MTKLSRRTITGLGLAAVAVAALSAGTLWGVTRASAHDERAAVTLHSTTGETVGRARLTEHDGKVRVRVEVHGLPPGFHGFHVHGVGDCDPATNFTSAGPHHNPGGQNHANHGGDMPSLFVNGDGTGAASFVTDHFTLSELFDADGSALVIHADPDNFANIPTRYTPMPDATTLGTGDSGARIACGKVESAS